MFRKVMFASVFLALGPMAVCAQNQSRTLYVRCGGLIYDAEKPPLANAAVVITDGKVTAVGADLQAPPGSQRIDLSGYTVMPGLIDAHTHIWAGPRGQRVSQTLAALRASKAIAYALESRVPPIPILGP